ncbi:hypothetical protein [Brevibacterium luteolum]|uniref:hypothetical protein n=1 Tax=Brevibacterium luteolum TaxID=199591 RepID=UPI00223B0415|nr:hypothetical protein [Brevibacterium luteolum]MCT1658164.1 hypothetical protein [Brevibacterium luteolum]MCT1872616.1 hypothetical protein [Brevibacterium luteolum]MCT1890589.1 hypothetical protein [Brevibacterium luteolum]MCT1893079.1 hypothetical protein [Brevibacterium luteolum]MCT1922433.1 hypothetical protein [Brevibacterium luteolum]
MSRFDDLASDTRYVPTPRHVCSVYDFSVPIADNLMLVVHLETYKNLVRTFSIEVQLDGRDVCGRIDTSHSLVHRHQFYRSGGEDDPPHAIEPIPAGIDGAKTVDRMFEEAYTMMLERAEDIARRWNR